MGAIDITYWPDITRIAAFSVYGLIIGLKITFIYAMWLNREVNLSKYAWALRALYVASHGVIFTGFILLLINRIGHHVPLNVPSSVCFYSGSLITVWLLYKGIKTERHVHNFIENGAWADGEGP